MPQRLEILQKQMQRMILSPQMQQAIHMLQMPLQELQLLVRQELDANPVLEETLEQEQPETPEPATAKEEKADDHESELNFKEEFDILTKLDDEWRDYFRQSGTYRKITQQDEERRKFMMDSIATEESLQEHLLWQLGMSITDPGKKELGETVIGNIDDNGYLNISAEELAAQSGKTADEIEEIIGIIQSFNPIGVCSRNLKECLLIQLDRLGNHDPIITKIIEDQLDLLAEHKYAEMASLLGISEDAVKKAVEFITTLDPKPGLMLSKETAQYITPDVFVEKIEGEYVVTLNDEKIPHLSISNLYRQLMSKKDTPVETKEYIKAKLQAGNWLIKNIHQRQQTIYKIAVEIVRVQREFMDEGVSFLKPLTMQQVAGEIGLHESTVSRAIANKYIQTPQGTFQIKYFFAGGIQTSSGESVSVINLKEQIANLIKAEDAKNPLSDQEIISKLSESGIKIARRTIAKYRQELGIPASNLRKRT